MAGTHFSIPYKNFILQNATSTEIHTNSLTQYTCKNTCTHIPFELFGCSLSGILNHSSLLHLLGCFMLSNPLFDNEVFISPAVDGSIKITNSQECVKS